MIVAQQEPREHSTAESSAALVVAAQAGSHEAFERLVREVGPLLYRFLFVRLRSEADAKDALQDTLIVAWQTLPSVRDPQAFRAWLLTIARRKARDLERRDRRRSDAQPEAVRWASGVDTGELACALRILSEEQREVVLLRYLVGLSEPETAAVVQVSVGTVKSRASRARARLQSLLAIERSNGGGRP